MKIDWLGVLRQVYKRVKGTNTNYVDSKRGNCVKTNGGKFVTANSNNFELCSRKYPISLSRDTLRVNLNLGDINMGIISVNVTRTLIIRGTVLVVSKIQAQLSAVANSRIQRPSSYSNIQHFSAERVEDKFHQKHDKLISVDFIEIVVSKSR